MNKVRQVDWEKGWKVPFFGIWTGQALSLVGSRAAQFALVWWLTQLTGSATVLATASLVGLLPEIALGPLAGAYVDRWERRRVMIAADVLIALAGLWLAYLFWTDAIQVWHVYVVMFVRSVGGAFHWPAMHASTSLMVPKEQLARVAGVNQTLNGVLNIVGPPLGALLMALLPLAGVMLLDVGTAMLAVVPLLFITIPQPRRAEMVAGEARPSVWADIKGGVRYIAAWPGLMVLIGVAMIIKVALTPAFSLTPLLVSAHFRGSAAQLGLFEAAVGVGIVAGGVGLSVWGGFRKKILTSMLGLSLLGLGLLGLGLVPADLFWLGAGCMLMVGLTIPLVDGPIMAIMQSTVAPEMQGRVLTMMGSLLWLTSPLGLGIAGPVSDWLGVQVWFLIAGGLCVAAGIAGVMVPALVNIEENQGAQVGVTGAEPARVGAD
jgi:MFS transporter, DHA3 family, macrolide efflux protein